MPADACGGSIFVEENLAKGVRRAIEKLSNFAPQRVNAGNGAASTTARRS
jgi:hypothetical protein